MDKVAAIIKTIKVKSYHITDKNLEDLKKSCKFIYVDKLFDIYGIDALIKDDSIYINKDSKKDKYLLIGNNFELSLTSEQEIDIVLSLGKDIEVPEVFEQMPAFGVTIDNNLNIQQFNLKMSDADEVFGNQSFIAFWGLDSILRVNLKTFTIDQATKYINYILEKGYYAPVTCYIDNGIKTTNFDNIYYFSKLLGLDYLPVRAMTYKDIKYIENICPCIHAAIKKVPCNRRYQQLDYSDESECMIINFSDKRTALQAYKKKEVLPVSTDPLKTYEETNWNDYKPIYYFVFDKRAEKLNANLVKTVYNEKYYSCSKRTDEKTGGYTSFGSELLSYLRGYKECITEGPETEDERKLSLDQHQECADDKNINAISVPLFNFSYKLYKTKEAAEVMKEQDADLLFFEDKMNALDFSSIHEAIRKPNMKIKYYRPK